MSTEITLSSPFILNLAFDLGYASIGWAVFAKEQGTNGSLLGCGALSFPSDDCLNKSRRAKRQLRRNILSRARRIKCVDKLLESLDVLTAEQIATLAKSPHPAPWQLAASALRQRKQLNWEELRAVLVWYAHNRGYDGNVLWSRQTEDKEDTKRQQKACDLMEEYGSDTMAETVCAFLRIDSGLKLQKGNNTPKRHFKGEEAAFPRKTVQKEVKEILDHQDCLEGCDEDFVEAICGEGKEAWKAKFCADIKLSRNYHGSLLFGQYKPRFDNRIIGKCPFTGKNVPNKASKAFLDYRLAVLIANLRVGEEGEKKRPLKAEECQKLFQQFEEKGRLTKTELKKSLKQLTGQEASNADRMFLTKEMEEALVLEPVKAFINKDKKIKPLWKTLPPTIQKQAEDTWAKKRPVSLEQIAAWLQESGEDTRAFLEAAKTSWDKQKKQKLDWEAYRKKGLSVDFPKGRAPYASVKLREAFETVMEGRHPKAKGECLDSNKREEAEEKRWEEAMKSATGKDSEEALFQKIDGLTNNHLVRHRLKILYRTLKDICTHYADGDKTRIGSICVETTRDLVAFSGMNEKEVAAKLNEEQKGFGDASQELDKAIEAHPGSYEKTARLLRKFRLWLEQGKQCPYTGRNIGADEILEEEVDIDHIIPRSLWDTDTLYNQVLTFKEINRRKSGQTAMQFIKEEGGEGDILTPRGYKKHVEGLKPARKGREDKRRCEKRKALLLASEVPEESTEGALTQTSHINKLSVKPLKAFFRDVEAEKRPKFLPLPGGITAKARGVWGLMGTLAQACPEVLDETDKVKPKKAIRSITHLHHAVDAVTLAVWTSRYPNDGKLWEALTKKCRKPEDRRCLHKFGLLDSRNRLRYPELPEDLKKNIADRLCERRVVQYMPKTMRGLKAGETLWGLRYEKDKDGKLVLQKDKDGRVKLYQKKELKTDKIFQENGKEYIRPSKKEKRRKQEHQRRFTKEDSEKPNKLLGLSPPQGQKSKLWDARKHKSKGVIIIEGNWGLALFGTPQTPTHSTIITHCRVFKQLEALKQKYGKAWAILRNGMLIDVAEGRYKGRWRIKSIKDDAKGIKLDLAKPYAVGSFRTLYKKNKELASRLFKVASLKTLLKSGLTIPSLSYTGHPTRKT